MKVFTALPASRLLPLAALFLTLLVAAPARAGLTICNDTDVRQSIAVGYKSGEAWESRGWWNVDPGACTTPVGGDLKNRYYYYRAEATGRTFVDDDYMFCTERAAFTISGDKECGARGYDRAGFRRIDTGPKAKSFTFRFDTAVSPAPPAPAPAPPKPAAKGPGTWGEPYSSGTAVFQDCVTETEAPFCTFHADGTKFYVYDDGRTPGYIFRSLQTFPPGTPVEVEGDLEAIHDRTADVVARKIQPRSWNSWDTTLDRLQGTWYSVNDPNSQFNIIGSELENIYDGAFGAREYLSTWDRCDGYTGNRLLIRRDEETGDVLCYSIEELGQFDMLLMYLPRANFHSYRKLD